MSGGKLSRKSSAVPDGIMSRKSSTVVPDNKKES